MHRFPHPAAAVAALRRGFTLIELLAVMMIIGILAVFLVPRVPEWIDQARVTACSQNLTEIYKGLKGYEMKYERLPAESGVKFFGAIISRGVFENTVGAARKLTCPGVNVGGLTIGTLEPEEWFADLAVVDGSYSAYAGRDVKNFPLRQMSGKEVLVADDNDGGPNHRTATNALMGDGTIVRHELVLLREKGLLGPEEELLVGPDSQVEDLRKLSLD